MESNTNSQEQDDGSTNTNHSLNASVDEYVNRLSADVATDQTDVSPPKVTDSGKEKQFAGSDITETGTNSNDNGSEIKNDVEANRKKKHLEKEPKGSSRINVEDKKDPEDVVKKMQMQKTHDLYCPNCTHNITGTVKRFEKGEEPPFPYNKEKFTLSFVIVISFKYPFIYLPWFHKITPEPTPSVVTEHPKKHLDWLRFVLVMVLLLLSAIVMWVPPSPSPLSPLPPSPPHTNESSTVVIPDPQKIPEGVTEIDGSLNRHGPDVVQDDKPFSLFKDFPSDRVLSVISLLLLAILALFWPSIPWTKRTKPENAYTIADLPNVENFQNGGAQDSPSKPEDKKEVLGDQDGGATEIDGLSTSGNNKNGSETETEIPPATPSTERSGILRKLVVQVKNILQTELDILKSIVYGGLIESITSFGVVSSAAASGTSTLNVLALGLANLFSGLFLIIYNLYGLVMSEPFYPSANIDHMSDVKATDPYEQLLGNRKNVILHCIVVVVSFVFFAVIPPLFYGFSFKITDNGHYEAAVFIAASIVCVISLSFAKAYAFGMDKLKTVAVYTGIAIGASALSFIASQHVGDLLEKYDFHKLASNYPKG